MEWLQNFKSTCTSLGIAPSQTSGYICAVSSELMVCTEQIQETYILYFLCHVMSIVLLVNLMFSSSLPIIIINNKEKKLINVKKNAIITMILISIDWDGCSSIILSYHMYNSNDNHD